MDKRLPYPKISPWANAAILMALPLAWFIPGLMMSPLIGFAALVDIRRNPHRSGGGRALAAIVIGLIAIAVVTFVGWRVWSTVHFVHEQPRSLLSMGDGAIDSDSFRDVFDVPDHVDDAAINDFTSTLHSRYGKLLSIRPTEPMAGSSNGLAFDCELEFESAVRHGRLGYKLSSETDSDTVPAVGLFAVLDDEQGDLAFPPSYMERLAESRLRAYLRSVNDRTSALSRCSYVAHGESYARMGLAVTERGNVKVRVLEDGSAEVAIDGSRQLVGDVPEIQFSVRANKNRESHWNQTVNDFAVFPPRVPGVVANGLLYLREFAHPTPFIDEASARDVTDEGFRELGGVECRVILVRYQQAPDQYARWYFGVDDLLPRRVERYRADDGTLRPILILSITDLQIDSTLSDADFAIDPRPKGR